MNIIEKLESIVQFFIDEEICDDALTLDFDEERGTAYESDICININISQLCESETGKEGSELTCRGSEHLLDKFNDFEISLFHELGHYCDAHYKYDFDHHAFFNEYARPSYFLMEHEIAPIRLCYQDTIHAKEVERLAFIAYRNMPVERSADINACRLMEYYLEHAK
jgi:hypothetical protein